MLIYIFAAFLQAQAADQVYHVGNGVSMPALLQKVDPEYSEIARHARVSGTVLVKLVVGADGMPRDIHVARPFGYGLDEKAVAAVTRWTFKPAMRNGEPVSVESTIEVNFQLLDSDRLHMGALSFDPIAGASPPVLVQVAKPSTRDVGPPAGPLGQVGFMVDEQGVPSNFTVLASQNADCDEAMLKALSHWRFQPAMKDGNPVAARGRVDYYLGKGMH